MYKSKNGQYLEAFANAVDSIGKLGNIQVIDLYHNPKLSIEKLMNFKRVKDPHSGLYKDFKYPGSINIPFDPNKDDYPYPKKAINLSYDGLHPSDEGNKIIAEQIIKEFRKLLRK
jgi:lysophospholipase L1-like esterase